MRSNLLIVGSKGLSQYKIVKEKYTGTTTDRPVFQKLLKQINEGDTIIFDSVSRATVCAYTRASIMSSKIPVALICAYHIGLRATMDRAKISYKIVDNLTKDIKSNVNLDWIEFNDGYVVYHVNYEST